MAQYPSVLWPSNIPLCLCITFVLIHSSVDGHVGCFRVLAIVNSAAMNTGYMFLLELWFSPSIFPVVALLDHMVLLFYFFNWGIIALQSCVGFCHTTLWISHNIYIIYISYIYIYVAYDGIYMSMLLSQFVLPSPSPTVSTNLFSSSASPFPLCKYILQYCFSRFHVYVLIYSICFSISDLHHSL